MWVMPEAQNPTPSERPVIAFFDVDNTLMHGTSAFHVGREAWAVCVTGPKRWGSWVCHVGPVS